MIPHCNSQRTFQEDKNHRALQNTWKYFHSSISSILLGWGVFLHLFRVCSPWPIYLRDLQNLLFSDFPTESFEHPGHLAGRHRTDHSESRQAGSMLFGNLSAQSLCSNVNGKSKEWLTLKKKSIEHIHWPICLWRWGQWNKHIDAQELCAETFLTPKMMLAFW